MYTLQNAARILGVAQSTLNIWIAQAGIEKIVIETDRPRKYISYIDIITLLDKHGLNLANLVKIPRRDKNSQGQELYTLAEAAKFLEVSVDTVKMWLSQSAIQKKVVVTDRKRVYLSYDDILLLVWKHRHKIQVERKDLEGTVISQEGDYYQIEQGEKELYTIEETALFLGVSASTVRRWLETSNISKKVIRTDRSRVYIQQSDVMLLADQHQKKPQEQDFYTIKDTAQLLSVSTRTVRTWIEKFAISKKVIRTDRPRVYIQYSHLMMYCISASEQVQSST